MNNAPDLTKTAPRSPRTRVGGYVILARMADKGRAELQGTAGEYHFGCPMDEELLDFKGVKAEEVRSVLQSGATDEQLAEWLNTHGLSKSPAEIQKWSDSVEAYHPYENPERREWFTDVATKAGLDPKSASLFDYLEADDRVTFANA